MQFLAVVLLVGAENDLSEDEKEEDRGGRWEEEEKEEDGGGSYGETAFKMIYYRTGRQATTNTISILCVRVRRSERPAVESVILSAAQLKVIFFLTVTAIWGGKKFEIG